MLAAATTRPFTSTSRAIAPEYARVAVRGSGGVHLGSGRTIATAGSNAAGALAVTRMGPGAEATTADDGAAGGAGAGSAGAAITGSAGATTMGREMTAIDGGGV